MKQVDFENGKTVNIILATAIPMLIAQILNLLYNIVDRIYIARIPVVGTAAIGAVGLCFPVVILITAFTNMYGSGGSPLFAMARGRGDEQEAEAIQNTSFTLLVLTAVFLLAFGELFGRPILSLFGTSEAAMQYALPYLRIYLLGTMFLMISTGMNPFINARGYSVIGMRTVMIGALANIVLDPVFIFALGWGISGAAIATVLSQGLSAAYVMKFYLGRENVYKLRFLTLRELRASIGRIRSIMGLGLAAFMMQFTNALVQICCNNVLTDVGGDIYVSVMTVIGSIRQLIETPLVAITEGTSPIISYNYGARRPRKVKGTIAVMFGFAFVYSFVIWMGIRLFPEAVIGIFSSNKEMLTDTIPAMHIYFSTFIFMTLQHSGQAVFKSIGKKYHAIFFSLFRKAAVVVTLTYLLPYVFGFGVNGVFAAEPISNVVGGCACFVTMLIVVSKELKKEELWKDSI